MRPALIPKERYVSPEYLAAEFEHLWPNVWIPAGWSADLPAPGSYFTFELGVESYLIVRQASGIRAFHNVCQHRGRRLREPGFGRAVSFQCPYHGWEWSLDGRLIRVPDADSFEGLTADSHPLASIACAEQAGFVWINPSGNAPSLTEYLGPVATLIEAYRPSEFALVEDQTLDMPCNWKACIDAFNEAYHLHAVHPEILGAVDDMHAEIERIGRHGRVIVPFYVPSPRSAQRAGIDPALGAMVAELKLPAEELAGAASELPAKIQRHLRARERAGAFDLSGLADRQLTESHHFHIFPNLLLDLTPLSMQLRRAIPHATDPGRMLFTQQRFDRVPAGAPKPSRPVPKRFALGGGSLGTVTDQDVFNLVRVQQGMQSSGYDGLVLGSQEDLVAHLHQTLDSYFPPQPVHDQ